MENYYIKFIEWDELSLKDAIQIAEHLWYNIWICDNPIWFTWKWILVLNKDWYYVTSLRTEKNRIELWFKEILLYKKLQPWTKIKITNWNICTINYSVDNYFNTDMWYCYSVKEVDNLYYSIDIKETKEEDCQFKIWDYVRIRKCKTVYIITDILSWDKAKLKNIRWCVYTIELSRLELASYINEKWNNLKPDVLTDGQTNTLITNNNTMEKLNLILSKEFFDNKENVKDIISLDTLLKDAIELTKNTQREMFNIETKLLWLNKKLESATDNQDVAMIKDLISSTKVIQDFVDELKWKTISKFENAKTKFDIVGYLKD